MNRRRLRLQNTLGGIFLGVLPLFFMVSASAQGNSAISQQFQTEDTRIVAASLVTIEADNPNSVELSKGDTAAKLVGVVNNSPLIELSSGGTGVQVITNGTTMALVSDLNGNIRAGDKITASPIAGVGMRAEASTTVVGTAQVGLDTVERETRTIKDKSNEEIKVSIGLIPVQVEVAFYEPDANKRSAFIPPFLQDLANNISGQEVSPLRVLAAALVLLLSFISAIVLLYSSVRSSIISIGRNPLSERAVRKSLLEVGLMVLGLLLLGAVLIYFILTL